MVTVPVPKNIILNVDGKQLLASWDIIEPTDTYEWQIEKFTGTEWVLFSNGRDTPPILRQGEWGTQYRFRVRTIRNIEIPTDWQEIFESEDIDIIKAWYLSNTGHEANGIAIGDLDRVGQITTNNNGQVLEGLHADAIRISHNDVIIRNCHISGVSNYGIQYDPTWDRLYGNTLIEYVSFDGWINQEIGQEYHAAYLAANDDRAIVSRCRITGYASGVSIRACTTVVECWIHGLYRAPGTHGTSATIRGFEGSVIRNLLEGPGGSSAVSLYADQGGPLNNALVEHNIMNDSYPIYQINAPNREYSAESENVRVRHNRFGPSAGPNPIAGLIENFTHPSNDFIDNRFLGDI